MTPLAAEGQKLELKGLSPGLPMEEVWIAFPGLQVSCETYKAGSCMYIPPKSYSRRASVEALNTLAGASVDYWTVGNRDGKVSQVAVSLHTNSFDNVLAAMREKFGPEASLENSTIKNRAGASFDQTAVQWRKGSQMLLIQRRSGSVDKMSVLLSSDAEMAAAKQDRDATAKKSAKDL